MCVHLEIKDKRVQVHFIPKSPAAKQILPKSHLVLLFRFNVGVTHYWK